MKPGFHPGDDFRKDGLPFARVPPGAINVFASAIDYKCNRCDALCGHCALSCGGYSYQMRKADRPRLVKMTVAPAVALFATVVVSGLGIHGLVADGDALRSALNSAASAHQLETIAAGLQGVNGSLYHILSLRGAQIKGFDGAAELHKVLADSDRVMRQLRDWRDTRATAEQRKRIDELMASVTRYQGAVDFVSQMLDVDFAAAVSFIRPFDRNFLELMQSVNALVQEVQARERQDAGLALTRGDNTIHAFEVVVATCLLVALIAASNMAWAARRSHRLTDQNKLLTRLTQVDALTGLGNRRSFDDTLAAAWADCTAQQAPLTLVMFDIDHFKKFNDSQGHQAGDACLRKVAGAVLASTRDDVDHACRYGGEEFAIILPNSPLPAGRVVAERVRRAIAGCAITHPAAPPPGIVTVSLGVASLVPTASVDTSALIEAADQALYAAKHGGRNRVCEAPPVAPRAADEGDGQSCEAAQVATSSIGR